MKECDFDQNFSSNSYSLIFFTFWYETYEESIDISEEQNDRCGSNGEIQLPGPKDASFTKDSQPVQPRKISCRGLRLMKNCVGQGYDGTSVVSGRLNSVQKKTS